MPWHFTATTIPQNRVPLDLKPICSTAYYSETLQLTTMDFQDSESPLFQKYTFSNYRGPLRVQDNGATEQWWYLDLDLESSRHRFAERTKGPRLKGSSSILEPTHELQTGSTFSAPLQLRWDSILPIFSAAILLTASTIMAKSWACCLWWNPNLVVFKW